MVRGHYLPAEGNSRDTLCESGGGNVLLQSTYSVVFYMKSNKGGGWGVLLYIKQNKEYSLTQILDPERKKMNVKHLRLLRSEDKSSADPDQLRSVQCHQELLVDLCMI